MELIVRHSLALAVSPQALLQLEGDSITQAFRGSTRISGIQESTQRTMASDIFDQAQSRGAPQCTQGFCSGWIAPLQTGHFGVRAMDTWDLGA